MFADLLEFDEEQPENNATSTPIFGRKDVDSQKSGKGGDDVGSTADDGNESDTESGLTSMPHYIEPPPRRSTRNRTEHVLYPGQIVYGSGSLPKINPKALEVGRSSSSANFVSSRTAKSHEDMVRVLGMFSSNVDNEGADEPASLKEAMARHDWPEWKMTMEREYNSLMENGTWKLVSPSNGANVITGKWCFKLKKDRFGHILKYKARWVVHGYKLKEGLDYVETFAAVVKPMSNKCLFALGVQRGYRMRRMDVVTAFLYGFLDEVFYVEQPHLFAT